jgi:hypothetical protein
LEPNNPYPNEIIIQYSSQPVDGPAKSESPVDGKHPMIYPLVICYSLPLKMTIYVVDLAIENGDFP